MLRTIYILNIEPCYENNSNLQYTLSPTTFIKMENLVGKLHEKKSWLCVISSDEDNVGVDINDDCSAMMGGGGPRFFTFYVKGKSQFTLMSVKGTLMEGGKVFVLHLGTGDPPFQEYSSLTCIQHVPENVSYVEHVQNTLGEMRCMFDGLDC